MRHDAFDEITEESAYWAGIMMTDGCLSFRVRKGNPGGEKAISLTLTESDKDHVEAFKKFIQTTNRIHVHTKKGFPGSRPRCRVGVSSARLFDALMRYGVTPRKSLTAKASILEANRDFWRGVVDGNGTITNCRHRGKGIGIGLSGSEALTSQFLAYAATIAPEYTPSVRPHSKTEGIYCVYFSGEPGISVVRSLYEGCSVALARKWIAAKDVIAQQGTVRQQKPWPKVSVEDLREMKQGHGSWVRVASHLGMSVSSLGELRSHLRRQGKSGLDDRAFPTNRCGERAPNAKLSDAQAMEMIRRRRSGEAIKSLSREYGVSQSVASQTCSGKIRKHLVYSLD